MTSHAWQDNDGQVWRFDITMWTVKRCKQETGWDLPNILNDGMAKLGELLADKLELFSVFCCLLEPQMEERGTTPEQLGSAIAGETLVAAVDAFIEALADFFPARQAGQLKELMNKSREVAEALANKADAELKQIDIGTLTEQVLNGLASSA
jgi:hypothetical protein